MPDITAPTVDSTTPIVTADSAGGDGVKDNTITIKFSEVVDATKITLANLGLTSSAGTGATISPTTGNAQSYTITLGSNHTLTTGNTITINKANVVDSVGNTASSDVSFTVPDIDAPTIAISSDVGILGPNETATITFTLSEASSDFTAADVSVAGGTLSNFTGSGTSYTATFTPTANSNTPGSVSVASNKFTDAEGYNNADGSDANNSISLTINTVDNDAPILQSKTEGTIGKASNLELSFDENVSLGDGTITVYDNGNSVIATITVTSGVVSGDGTVTINNNIATIDLASDLTENTSYYAKVTSGVFKDSAGNAYGGINGTGDWSFEAKGLTTSVTWGGSGVDSTDGFISASELSTATITGALGNYISATGVQVDSIVFTATDGSSFTVNSGITQPTDSNTNTAWTLSNNSSWTNQLVDGKSYSIKVNLVSTGAGTPSGSGSASAVTIDKSAGITINSIASDNIIDSIEANSAVTISGTTTSVENGRTVTVKLEATGYTTTTYTTTVTNNTWSLSIPSETIKALADKEYTVKADVTDAQGNAATQASRNVTVAKSPKADGLEYGDTDNDGNLEANETITVKFSEVVDLSKLSMASFSVANSGGTAHSFGSGASLNQTSGFDNKVTITLGSSTTVVANDIIKVNKDHVVNANNNKPSADLEYTIPSDITPPNAPIFASATLFGDNTISTSEISSGDVSITFSGLTIGDTLTVYVNGIAKKSITATGASQAITLSTSDLGANGVKGISATATDTSGNESNKSVTKNITLDTNVEGIESIVLTKDLDSTPPTTLEADDEITLTFEEAVKLNDGGDAIDAFHTDTKAAFGTGATAVAVNADSNGYSTQWKITLKGTPTLSTNSDIILKAGEVKDVAGNTNSSTITKNVPDDLFSARQAPTVQNVDTNNVIESAGDKTVTVSLDATKAQVGDIVRLYIDGEEVGSTTISGSVPATLDIIVAQDKWGADGVKGLTARVDATANSGNLSEESDVREVYINADQDHWSTSNIIWFDPDTLSNGAVSSWTASAGGSIATQGTASSQPIVKTDKNGHKYLTLDGTNDWLSFTDPNNILPTGNAQVSVIAVGKTGTTASGWGWISTYGNPTTAQSPGLGQNGNNVGLVTYGNDLISANAATIGSNALFSGTIAARDFKLYSNSQLIQTKTDGSTTLNVVKNYMRIGRQVNTGSEYWQGDIMDVIWFNGIISQTQRQEIETYLSVKYETAGIKVTSSTNTYDLTTSSESNTLIDQVTKTGAGNQTFKVSGSDYVRAGAGDDKVILSDFNFRQLDGGKGKDTLELSSTVSPTTINLSDHVSDARANSNGWHKLYGFEKIDLTGSTYAQTLELKAEDIDQMSETKKLEVILGDNDILKLKTAGLTEGAGELYNGVTYDKKFTGTVGSDNVTLYVKGGSIQSELTTDNSGQTISGYSGDDTIIGGTAADTLSGLAGNDTLTGGGGSDTFDYNSTSDGNDTITDFTLGNGGDKLDLRDLLSYSSNQDLADYIQITHDTNTGTVTLNIDSDGSGSSTDNSAFSADMTITLNNMGSNALTLSDFTDYNIMAV